MNKQRSDGSLIKSIGVGRRQPLRVSQESLVRTYCHDPARPLPLVVEAAADDLDLATWTRANRDWVETRLQEHGAILWRGFGVKTAVEFGQVIEAISGEIMLYNERSSPRSHVSGNIYTSTDHPADQRIFPHNELSYSLTWPMKIYFFCAIPSLEGGETPIADCRRVFRRIRPEIKQRFEDKKWMLVRNFGSRFGLKWQTAFQTTDRSVVENYCRNARIEFEWKEGDRLRTRQIRNVTARHPKTGEKVWFNHATFFHVSTLESAIQEIFREGFPEDSWPTNSCYGDGSPIEPSVLDRLREAYFAETVAFHWQAGDILMLDNMLTAHGRASYVGARKVLVGMAEPFTCDQI